MAESNQIGVLVIPVNGINILVNGGYITVHDSYIRVHGSYITLLISGHYLLPAMPRDREIT